MAADWAPVLSPRARPTECACAVLRPRAPLTDCACAVPRPRSPPADWPCPGLSPHARPSAHLAHAASNVLLNDAARLERQSGSSRPAAAAAGRAALESAAAGRAAAASESAAAGRAAAAAAAGQRAQPAHTARFKPTHHARRHSEGVRCGCGPALASVL
eukprot:358937-Chlamydomonas_euryale.AAC.2